MVAQWLGLADWISSDVWDFKKKDTKSNQSNHLK